MTTLAVPEYREKALDPSGNSGGRMRSRTSDVLSFAETVAAAVVLAAWVTFLSLVYTLIAYPQADDLERTAAMRDVPPWYCVWSDYTHIDGRWESLFIQHFSYQGDHVTTRYPFMRAVPIFIGLAACMAMMALVLGGFLFRSQYITAGAAVKTDPASRRL